MQRRAWLAVVNLAVAAAVLVVWFGFPRYAEYALFAFFGWFIVSLPTMWVARGGPGPAAATPTGPTAAPAAAAPPPIAFCIYCAADLPAGAGRCPACGHAVPRFG